MATHFNSNLNIKGQLETADLIITGKIEQKISTSVLKDSDTRIVQSTYKILVDKLLSGAYKKKNLKVTIVGGEVEGYKTDKTVPFEEGQNYLMLLGKDYGLDKKDDEFVPFYCSCFKINKDNRLECPKDIETELIENNIIKDSKQLNLKTVVQQFKEVVKLKKESNKKLLELEPEEMNLKFIAENDFEMPPETENGLKEGKIGNLQKE